MGVVPRRASATSGYQRLLHSEAVKTLNWFRPAECNASQFQWCLPFVIDKHPAQVSADNVSAGAYMQNRYSRKEMKLMGKVMWHGRNLSHFDPASKFNL